ncbi:hypothetical protein CLAFUW4_13730 [Fulvia fulva]|uniref:Uncharacterized protein n=1 Tax=Passalora fulva TaxID=5499 RepID=A0A9Q8UVX4_PASFU|nr:uncharacterized protein CLAFUR5_13578 [Fulvia fulva]KAK4610445.1 hypothetical protein CLAFUR4_13733 [Fulvia fulva]KAK4611033.1 hypothetical protein CLAFUR0_13737 [Fulvia fulva]UJO24444.1 hypothetical protein CLAFUR5_13578 [Fulvia fulva]WPV22161.1 hypothetical protein CLAFUW4_13730 [Fulvia fulva]WPV36841.1 hypothetical protein CLAFUW7_13738 [Fulvia fulva]
MAPLTIELTPILASTIHYQSAVAINTENILSSAVLVALLAFFSLTLPRMMESGGRKHEFRSSRLLYDSKNAAEKTPPGIHLSMKLAMKTIRQVSP